MNSPHLFLLVICAISYLAWLEAHKLYWFFQRSSFFLNDFLFSISLISDVYYFLFLLHLVLCCFLLYRSLEWELRLLIWNFPSFVVYAIENIFFNALLYLTYLTSHSARFRSISNIYLKTDLVCHPQRVSLKFWIL